MNSVTRPIEKSWRELDGLVQSLGSEGLMLTGADGWAVKDHLIHVAAWERSLIALLQRRDRWAAMGVTRGLEGADAINAAVWAMHREEAPDAALDEFHQTHSLLMAVLGPLGDADLDRPYNDYQPDDPRDPNENHPVRAWVAGNTYEHYAEHIDWINQLVRDSSATR